MVRWSENPTQIESKLSERNTTFYRQNDEKKTETKNGSNHENTHKKL